MRIEQLPDVLTCAVFNDCGQLVEFIASRASPPASDPQPAAKAYRRPDHPPHLGPAGAVILDFRQGAR